jgi:predicted esterase
VSVLVDGTFPWKESPESLDHDKAAVEAELVMVNQAHELLSAWPGVDPERTALVGHDFGAMYLASHFGTSSEPVGLVAMTPTARWADWFLRYWEIEGDPELYRSEMAPLDPITGLENGGGRPVLLQFGQFDQYVSSDVAGEITAAAGESATSTTYAAEHSLDEAARADREVWLSELLGLEE